MNEKQIAAMRQALRALKRMKGYGNTFLYRQTEQNPFEQTCEAITALTAALADQALDKMAENAREIGLDYEPVANAWQQGYDQGVADERTSEANIGIAGFDAKVNPARVNPYTHPVKQPTEVIDPDSRTISVYEQPAQDELADDKALILAIWLQANYEADEIDETAEELRRLHSENRMLWKEREKPHRQLELYVRECNRLESERDAALLVQPAQQTHCDDCGGFDPECPLAKPAQHEIEELTAQRDQLADILTRTANALKGQPAELAQHSWHDLPEVAQKLKAEHQEPFGYFRPEPFGWTDCAETDEGAIALYDHPQAREPLTDEQIDRAIAELGLNYFADAANNRSVLRELCRRAAHGITGEKK